MSRYRRVLDWWNDFQDRRRVHQIASHWYQKGSFVPYAVAEEERYLRLKLEEFRNFASHRYLDDQSLLIDDIKQEWLSAVVQPMARFSQTRESAKLLKAAVAVMGDEMFVGAAKRARQRELAEAVAQAGQSAPGNRRLMREQAMRLR